MKSLNILPLAFLLALPNVHAATSSSTKQKRLVAQNTSRSTLKMDNTDPKRNKVDGDIDQEITNPKLRAESGSKSKISMSFGVNYQGSSLQEPLAADRPNLYAAAGSEQFSALDGSVSTRYRLDKNNSFTLGVGLGMITPLQGDVDGNDGKNQFRVKNPSVAYSRVFQAWGLQNIFSAGVNIGTDTIASDMDRVVSPSVGYTLMKDFKNRLSMGISASYVYSYYSTSAGENKKFTTNSYGGDARTEYDIGLYPMAEYALTDKMSLRTVARYTSWFHLLGSKENSLLHENGTQSFGVGYAVSRDIYLYPNVQFLWQDLKSERTNVALSATINLF